MTNQEYYGLWLSLVVRTLGKIVFTVLAIPFFIPILLFLAAWKASKLLYYSVASLTLLMFTRRGREYFRNPSTLVGTRDAEYDGVVKTGGRNDRRLEDGFNVDLDRDFMGAVKTRSKAVAIGKAL